MLKKTISISLFLSTLGIINSGSINACQCYCVFGNTPKLIGQKPSWAACWASCQSSGANSATCP